MSTTAYADYDLKISISGREVDGKGEITIVLAEFSDGDCVWSNRGKFLADPKLASAEDIQNFIRDEVKNKLLDWVDRSFSIEER